MERVVFTGDIAFSRYFQDGWRSEGSLSAEVEEYLREADYVVANVESPLSDGKIISDRALNHVSDPEAGKYLASLNMKVWNLANNHILDCGVKGLADTLQTARENNCQTIGAGCNLDEAMKPVILGESVKVGIVSVASATWKYLMAGNNTYGAMTWDKMSQLRNTISKLKKEADWVVIIAHGGDEYCDIALPYMRKKYHELLDLGADIIVGHHPHVIQNYERVGKKIIFYSLGNFIFDTETQRKYAHTDNGMLLGINFNKKEFTFDDMTIRIDREKQRVEPGVTPVVFREIDNSEFARIWPLQAKVFYAVDLKKRKNQSARLGSANRFLVWGHEVFQCRKKENEPS